MFVALIVESDLNSTTRSMFVALIVESDLNSTTRSMFVALIVESDLKMQHVRAWALDVSLSANEY
jgi:hypothetical protein